MNLSLIVSLVMNVSDRDRDHHYVVMNLTLSLDVNLDRRVNRDTADSLNRRVADNLNYDVNVD